VHSIGRREEHDVISAVYPDDSSEFAAKSKLAAPICETPEKRARFEKTLVAIRDIIGDLQENWPRWRTVPGLNGERAGTKSPLLRTHSLDCSSRTKSSRSMSVPSTPGGKGTNERSSSICSRSTSTLCHLTPNRAAAQKAIEVIMPNRAARSGCADGKRGSFGAAKTMIERTEQRFGLKPDRLAADTAYGSAANLHWLVNDKNAELSPFVRSAQKVN
jgi:hypothetical protein